MANSTIKYTGTASERRILKEDFQQVGIDDQDAVIFNQENQFTAEVSKAAADYMTARDSFEVASKSAESDSKSSKGDTKGKS